MKTVWRRRTGHCTERGATAATLDAGGHALDIMAVKLTGPKAVLQSVAAAHKQSII